MAEPKPQRRRPGRPSQSIDRSELVSLARRTFAQRGYAGTSMRVVAEGAGLTKAALFHHFRSKEAMYLEAMSSVVSALQALVAAAARPDGSFLDRLDRLGAMCVDYFCGHPEAGRLLTRELMGGGLYMQRGGVDTVDSILRLIAAFLEAGMREGSITTQDPRQLALSIAGLHLYLFVSPDASSRFLEVDVFSDDHRAARAGAIQQQVRLLCGAAPTASG